MQRFGTILRRARLARGWTLDDVARRVRSHKGYISGMENRNVNPPSAALVLKLAQLYELDGTELLLHAIAEKAPTQVRAELNRRVFGSNSREHPKRIASREKMKLRRIASKAERLRLLVEELLEEIR